MKVRVTWGVLALVLGLVVVSTPGGAWAGAPTEQLRVQMDRVIRILEDPSLKREGRQPERRAAIRGVANDIFDFTETTRRSLGRHWQARTPAEREEIVRLFSDLLERSYIGKIETYSGERILFGGDSIDGEQATVRTRLVTKAGTEIPVDYRMHRVEGGRWLSYDVSIEGVSLVASYRAQFNKIIQTSGYKALVDKLAAKQEEDLTISKASQRK